MSQHLDYAVVLGIARYDHPGFAPLPGAKSDATDFAKWLQGSCCEDPLPVEHIIQTLSEVTTTDFGRAITKLLDEVPKTRRLYLFVAGHGGGVPTKPL